MLYPQPAPTANLIANYLQELRAIRATGSATDEASFYSPIEHLFNAIGAALTPPILFSTQLKSQCAGMPDGGFFPQRTKTRKEPGAPLSRRDVGFEGTREKSEPNLTNPNAAYFK